MEPNNQTNGIKQGPSEGLERSSEAGSESFGEGNLTDHQAYHADDLFGNLELEPRDTHQEAIYALYNAPQEASAKLAEAFRSAGDARGIIRAHTREFYQSIFKREFESEEKETEFFKYIQIELNKVIDQLYDDFGSKKREERWGEQEIERMREKGLIQNGEEINTKKLVGKRRIGLDRLDEDGKPRQHMTDAWIRFMDRKRKDQLTTKIPQATLLSAEPRKNNTLGEIVNKILVAEEEPYISDLERLAAGKDLSTTITRRLNASKTGDGWAEVMAGLIEEGIRLPLNQERDEEIEHAVRKKLGVLDHQSWQEFFNEKHPDFGNTLSLSELQENLKKWTPLQKDILLNYLEQNENEIPIEVVEKFAEAYKILEGTRFGQGMETNLNYGEKIPREITIEVGSQVLADIVKNYSSSGNLPQKTTEWFNKIKEVQDQHPQLIKNKKGKYHYKAKDFNGEKVEQTIEAEPNGKNKNQDKQNEITKAFLEGLNPEQLARMYADVFDPKEYEKDVEAKERKIAGVEDVTDQALAFLEQEQPIGLKNPALPEYPQTDYEKLTPDQQKIVDLIMSGENLDQITVAINQVNKDHFGWTEGLYLTAAKILENKMELVLGSNLHEKAEAVKEAFKILGIEGRGRLLNFFNENHPPYGEFIEMNEISPTWPRPIQALIAQRLKQGKKVPSTLAINFIKAYQALNLEGEGSQTLLKIDPNINWEVKNKFMFNSALALFNQLAEEEKTSLSAEKMVAELLKWQEAQYKYYGLEKVNDKYRESVLGLIANVVEGKVAQVEPKAKDKPLAEAEAEAEAAEAEAAEAEAQLEATIQLANAESENKPPENKLQEATTSPNSPKEWENKIVLTRTEDPLG